MKGLPENNGNGEEREERFLDAVKALIQAKRIRCIEELRTSFQELGIELDSRHEQAVEEILKND